MLIMAALCFRRLGCWIILVLTGLGIPLGVISNAMADGGHGYLKTQKQGFPYLTIIQYHDSAARGGSTIWFWTIAAQFMVYGVGACFAYSTERRWRNLAIYVAIVAVIHALAYGFANYLVHGNG